MDKERIIKILSNHRQPHRLEHPKALTVRSIVNLIEHSFPPDHVVDPDQVRDCLQELQAEGEVLAGVGNQFCMAPPTVLVESETNFVGALFRGDRAYLKLAHQALETGQLIGQTQLHPKISGFHRIKKCLASHGIRLLTVTDSISHLPRPEKPDLHLLTGAARSEDPFQVLGQVMQYVPQEWKSQRERWQIIERANQRASQLLRLSTGEYLWFEKDQANQGRFYELSPDVASLAMFWLDQRANLPLRIPWDETPGRLNLQGTVLPSSYAQWLWRLSKPDPDQPRTRLFEPDRRPVVREALTQLGCSLV